MALEFDGTSQYIQVAQTADLPIYNEITYSVCGWVKAPAQADKRVFAERNSSTTNPFFGIGSGRAEETVTNKLRVYVRDNEGGQPLSSIGCTSTTTVFDDTWHHFCWVDNNGTAKLYIDGALDPTDFNYTRSGTFTLDRTSIAATVGTSVGSWLSGMLFDVRIYNRALSSNENAEIYGRQGSDKVWDGIVGWWRLDEKTSGQTASGAGSVIDLSGKGNNGTPYNSPIYRDSPHRLRRGTLVS